MDTGKKKLELYNMALNPGQSKDVTAANPAILEKLQALAKSTHEPQRPGTYSTRDRADRDRKAP